MTAKSLTIQTNNPFALIQRIPDKWQGYVRSLPSGFLVFDTPLNGARAGWINLWNTYLSKGINTPNKIVPIYAPDGGGKNGAYANFIATRLGITTDTPITSAKQIWELGRAIVFFEAGRDWYPDTQLYEAYNLAKQRVKLPDLTRLSPEQPVVPGRKEGKKKAPIALIVGAVAALGLFTLWIRNRK